MNKLVTIGEAAEYLGVSIDTIRRWDKKGELNPVRNEHNRRLFSLVELEEVKNNQPMTISDAAAELGISPSSLRRYERQGLIKPQRNDIGERRYTRTVLREFEQYNRAEAQKSTQNPAKNMGPLVSTPGVGTESDSVGTSLTPGVLSQDKDSGQAAGTVSVEDTVSARMTSDTSRWAHLTSFDRLASEMSVRGATFAVFAIVFSLVGLAGILLWSNGKSPIVSDTTYSSYTTDMTDKSDRTNSIAAVGRRILGSIIGITTPGVGTSLTPGVENRENSRVLGERSVLAAETFSPVDLVTFNIQAAFEKLVNANQGLEVAGDVNVDGDLDLGTGNLTAGNVIYSLIAGDNITITGTQDLTISAKASGVTTLQSKTGALSLEAGGGISIDGLKISNSDKGSSQSVFKNIAVSGADTVVADGNDDTLTFVAGSGISLSTTASSDTLTITSTADPGWTDDGTTVRLSTISDLVGIGTTSPTAKVDILRTSEQLRLAYDSSNYSSFTVSSGGNLTIAPSGGTLAVTGALTTSGAVTLGDATGDNITFTGRLANGTSILPNTDLGSDLGSSALRFNNLWVANINSNSSQSFSGQTTFSYAPTATTLAQATVIINPTTSVANGQLLALAIAGFQRSLIDAEGDLIVGYNDLTSAPTTDYPLNIYGHSGTRVGYVDTSGNMTISGTLTSGGSTFSSNITMADDTWIGLGAAAGRLEFDDQATDELNILSANVGIGTSVPAGVLHVTGSATGVDQIRVNGPTGLTADLQEWQINGTTFAQLKANGGMNFAGTSGVYVAWSGGATVGGGADGGAITFSGGGSPGTVIDTNSTTGVALTLQGETSHTVSLFDVNTANVSGDIMNLDWGSATTQTGALTGFDLDFTNLTADGTNALYGLHINDHAGATGSTEYGIYQEGTNWDYGIYAQDLVGIDNDLQFIGAQTISTTTGNLTIDSGGTLAISDNTEITSGATTQTALSLAAASLTTGEAFDITSTSAPTDGSTNEAIDINITHTPTTLADNFRAFDLDISDGTALGNTIYNLDSTLTLTGNAAKTGYGLSSTVTTSSTTADTLYGGYLTTTATGIITTGTRSAYGLYSNPTAGAESTGGTTNVYGLYSKADADVGVGGTVNGYGLYIANGTYDTDGTSVQYGLYVESPTGADTNYGAIFAGGNVGIGDTTPDAILNILSTSEQLRLDYDDSNYASFTVGSTGNLTMDLTGTSPSYIMQDKLDLNADLDLDSNSATAFTVGDGSATFLTVDATTDAGDTVVTLDGTGVSSGNLMALTADAITTGDGIDLSVDALSSGRGLYVESTSTALSTGDLASLYWNPGSATTGSSGSSILTLNVGANGTIDKILDVQDNASSVFSVSQSAITSALPHSFTAAGDVAIAYDLNFTNQTASYIKSNAPLYIEAGESFENNDLTLKTYGTGDLVFDLAGGATLAQAQAWDLANSSTTSLNIEDGLLDFDTTNSRIGINDTSPDAKFDIDSTSTSGGDFLITNTGVSASGTIAGITANSLTTGDVLTLNATGMTTGSLLVGTGSSSTGVTDHFVKLTSDVGSAAALIYGAPDFSGSAVTGYGLNITATDATGNANTDYGVYSSLALTGNAAKTGYGLYDTVTSSSTTADTLYGAYSTTSVTGIMTTGTRSVYGLYSNPTAGAESTGGTTNVYGLYSKADADVAAGGTVNGYGLYVANGAYDTDGTSTQYGLYVESPTGADTNYAAIFAGGSVGIGNTAPTDTLHVTGNGLFTTGVHFGLDDDRLLIDDAANGSASSTLYIGNSSINVTAPSDIRVKENITESSLSLDIINSLHLVDFNYIYDSDKKLQHGLIAQEVAQVFPYAVSYDPDGLMRVQYKDFIPLLLKGVQELGSRLAGFQTQLDEQGSILSAQSTPGVGTESDSVGTSLTDSAELMAEAPGVLSAQSAGADDLYDERVTKVEEELSVLSQSNSLLAEKVASLEIDGKTPGVGTTLTPGVEEESSTDIIASASAVLSAADNLLNNEATLSGLLVTGKSNLYDLSVSGRADFGMLSITGLSDGKTPEVGTSLTSGVEEELVGSAINALGTLYLQSDYGSGPVDVFNGEITMSDKGDAVFAGTVTAEKFAIDTSAKISSTLGSGTIAAGQISIVVKTIVVTKDSKVFVTATTATGNQQLIVAKKTPEVGFTVEIEKPYTKDIEFDWFLVEEISDTQIE